MAVGAGRWLHEEHRSGRKSVGAFFSPAEGDWRTAAMIVSALTLLFLLNEYSHLLFHSVVEVLGVICAGGIFVTVWHGRREIDNAAILVLGTSALFVGIFDLLHMHYSRGVVTFPLGGPDLPGHVWIAGRYFQSLAFLAAALLVHRRVQAGTLFAVSATATMAVLASLFLWYRVSAHTLTGDGLTSFDRTSEVAVSCVFIVALALLARRRRAFDIAVFEPLAASLFAVIGAQALFLFSRDALDLSNFLGHILQLFGYLFLYRAVIEAALAGPRADLLRKLERSEEALREKDSLLESYLDTAGVIIIVLNADQTVGLINRTGESVLGYSRDELLRRNWFDAVVPAAGRDAAKTAFDREIARGATSDEGAGEQDVVTKKGDRRTIVWRAAVLRDMEGRAIARVGSGEDVTERRRAEADQELLIQDLRTALNRVKTLSGLLPICAGCKKIRDDKGYWSQVETYVERHSDAHFTHGLCPDCAQRLYPELFPDGMTPKE
jgi:PAS domain S-box-containing protein